LFHHRHHYRCLDRPWSMMVGGNAGLLVLGL
jgi:hypothetical protein